MKELKISDEAVEKATGKTWKQWFVILDKIGARELGHLQTARHLRTELRLSPWWAQTVTIRYEKEKGYWVRSGKISKIGSLG